MSPQRLREVRFAEQWRGYRTEEVDEFVERVAEAFDALEARLRETSDRAARAEQALSDRGAEDAVSRTLVLAQRTADAAVQEAQAEATRLVALAEERAQAVVAEAHERAAQQRAEIEARAATETHDLTALRRSLESDVVLLRAYVRNQRAALVEELREHLRWLENGEHLPPPPVSGPWSERAPSGESIPGNRLTPAAAGNGASVPSVDDLVALASRAEALRRGFPSRAAPEAVDDPIAAVAPAPADVAAVAPPPAGDAPPGHERSTAAADVHGVDDGTRSGAPSAAGADEEETGGAAAPEEAPAEAEEIAWRDPPPTDGADDRDGAPAPRRPAPTSVDEDPFIAELRRAVDDPEPLGPRDDEALWIEEHPGSAATEQAMPARFLRRRRP